MSLVGRDGAFYLDGQKVVLLSGAVHYFRIVPDYWRDRLLKVKAAGLNCVETYVPWNLHEETKGEFRFDRGLDIRRFIQTAADVGLHVILRPGPYICSEWDFGGLPSWLLSDPHMKVRSSYQPYLDAVERYFSVLLPLISDLQHTNGGPIIAVQVENEYGSYGNDMEYKIELRESMRRHGITELLFTSDNGTGIQVGNIPEVLVTANFQETEHGYLMLNYLRHVKQPGSPLFVMEYWAGWFDHWGGKHSIVDPDKFESCLRWILNEGSSVNFYMFHGGTNFGWMAGANEGLGATNEGGYQEPYAADVTSYDYDCPVSESGQPTEKFNKIREVLRDFQDKFPEGTVPSEFPSLPDPIESAAYGEVEMNSWMNFEEILQHFPSLPVEQPVSMEMLDINNGGGQGYGFILYRKSDVAASSVTFTGRVCDRTVVYVDGEEVDTFDSSEEDHVSRLTPESWCTLDVLVENTGRVNYASFSSPVMDQQRKGVTGAVLGDDQVISDWLVYPLEFKARHVKRMVDEGTWQTGVAPSRQPLLYRGTLHITDTPRDTYLSMKGWHKGVVFVNGFNLGRYWKIGPQETLYVPAPLLKQGANEVVVFEVHEGAGSTLSVDRPSLGVPALHSTIVPSWARLTIFGLKSILKLGPWVWQILRLFLK